MLSINVLAMLIAFVAVVALVNFLIGAPQMWFGISSPVTLQMLLGWVNAPFAWLMGVPTGDCVALGGILGERIVLNEFIGYASLTSPNLAISDRAFVIGSYALCGFANFSSIAIQLGGIGAMVPSRKADLARLGFKAMICGTMASYISASLAGILM